MDYQVLLKELKQNLQSGLTWGTVRWHSILASWSSNTSSFETGESSLEFQALSLEVQEARFLHEIIFVQSRCCSEIRTVDQWLQGGVL